MENFETFYTVKDALNFKIIFCIQAMVLGQHGVPGMIVLSHAVEEKKNGLENV